MMSFQAHFFSQREGRSIRLWSGCSILRPSGSPVYIRYLASVINSGSLGIISSFGSNLPNRRRYSVQVVIYCLKGTAHLEVLTRSQSLRRCISRVDQASPGAMSLRKILVFHVDLDIYPSCQLHWLASPSVTLPSYASLATRSVELNKRMGTI